MFKNRDVGIYRGEFKCLNSFSVVFKINIKRCKIRRINIKNYYLKFLLFLNFILLLQLIKNRLQLVINLL